MIKDGDDVRRDVFKAKVAGGRRALDNALHKARLIVCEMPLGKSGDSPVSPARVVRCKLSAQRLQPEIPAPN